MIEQADKYIKTRLIGRS